MERNIESKQIPLSLDVVQQIAQYGDWILIGAADLKGCSFKFRKISIDDQGGIILHAKGHRLPYRMSDVRFEACYHEGVAIFFKISVNVIEQEEGKTPVSKLAVTLFSQKKSEESLSLLGQRTERDLRLEYLIEEQDTFPVHANIVAAVTTNRGWVFDGVNVFQNQHSQPFLCMTQDPAHGMIMFCCLEYAFNFSEKDVEFVAHRGSGRAIIYRIDGYSVDDRPHAAVPRSLLFTLNNPELHLEYIQSLARLPQTMRQEPPRGIIRGRSLVVPDAQKRLRQSYRDAFTTEEIAPHLPEGMTLEWDDTQVRIALPDGTQLCFCPTAFDQEDPYYENDLPILNAEVRRDSHDLLICDPNRAHKKS